MRKAWATKKEDVINALLFSILGIALAFVCAMLAMFMLYGSGHREPSFPRDVFLLLVSQSLLAGWAVYLQIPIFYLTWGLLTVLAYFKMKMVTFLAFILLGAYAFWATSEILGHGLTLKEIYLSLISSVKLLTNGPAAKTIVGSLISVLFFTLPAYIFGLLFLPLKYRPHLVISCITIPIAVFVLSISAIYLFHDRLKHNDSDLVDFAAQEALHPVTPLMTAAGDGTPQEVKAQLDKGIDINAKNVNGATALMYAALAAKNDNIQVLIKAGADINVQDNEGNTALSFARQQGHDKTVELLLNTGAKDIPRSADKP